MVESGGPLDCGRRMFFTEIRGQEDREKGKGKG